MLAATVELAEADGLAATVGLTETLALADADPAAVFGGPTRTTRAQRSHEHEAHRCNDKSPHDHELQASPVNRSYASMYFSRVLATTSSGSGGGGVSDARSQPDAGEVSQSRTYCLSNDGCAWPGS